jgi:hypothetical protein
MKQALAALALLVCSTSAFATGVSISVAPANPVIIEATTTFPDNKGILLAPWFKAGFALHNEYNEPITINEIQFLIYDSHGNRTVKDYKMPSTVEIAARSTRDLGIIYLDAMPYNTTYNYNVKIMINGWRGTMTSPIERISSEMLFVTQ